MSVGRGSPQFAFQYPFFANICSGERVAHAVRVPEQWGGVGNPRCPAGETQMHLGGRGTARPVVTMRRLFQPFDRKIDRKWHSIRVLCLSARLTNTDRKALICNTWDQKHFCIVDTWNIYI